MFSGVGAILSTAAVALPMLIIGKLIYGMGIAFALHAAPPYLAEMGHPSIRGLLIGCGSQGCSD
jgi:MFS family permease